MLMRDILYGLYENEDYFGSECTNALEKRADISFTSGLIAAERIEDLPVKLEDISSESDWNYIINSVLDSTVANQSIGPDYSSNSTEVQSLLNKHYERLTISLKQQEEEEEKVAFLEEQYSFKNLVEEARQEFEKSQSHSAANPFYQVNHQQSDVRCRKCQSGDTFSFPITNRGLDEPSRLMVYCISCRTRGIQ